MEELKKKLMENMENDSIFVFKHLFYGKYGMITPSQFIEWLPLADLIIQVAFIGYSLVHIIQFNPTRFEGIVKLLTWSVVFFFLCMLITLLFYLQHKAELKRPEGSMIYKAYFFSRAFFLTFGSLVLFALFLIEGFIRNFHSVTIDGDVRESIELSMESMPYKLSTLKMANIIFGIFALLALTHQLYWSIYLDISWCSCNYIQLEKLAEEKIRRNQGEEEEQKEEAK